MARFFLPKEKIQDQHGTIVGAELAHLRRVLRLGPGDQLTLFDDTGWEHEAVIRAFSATEATSILCARTGLNASRHCKSLWLWA